MRPRHSLSTAAGAGGCPLSLTALAALRYRGPVLPARRGGSLPKELPRTLTPCGPCAIRSLIRSQIAPRQDDQTERPIPYLKPCPRASIVSLARCLGLPMGDPLAP